MKLSTLDLPDKSERPLALAEELPQGVIIEDVYQGLKAWSNPINGFRVVRLHYSVDPQKRRPEWRDRERRRYGESEWNREYELMWEALEGRAVYADWWDADFHAAKQALGWDSKRPVCRGWDFGLNGACIMGQLFPHGRLFVLREAVSENIGFERFVEEAHRLSLEWFPGASFVEFIDPSGRHRMGADERTYASMLMNPPLRARKVISGAIDLPARIKGVTDFLKENVRGLPCFVIDPSCETLIKGFNGGYHYGLNKQGELKDVPEKDQFSHPHDALQYLASRVRNVKLDTPVHAGQIKEPRYGKEGPDAAEIYAKM